VSLANPVDPHGFGGFMPSLFVRLHMLPVVAFVVIALIGARAAPVLGAPTARPNIVILLADDLGFGDLGFTGSRDIPTPRLDQLAAESVRCTSGYVTAPQCSPMRAGLLTGRYQQRFGYEFNAFNRAPSFNQWLKESTMADRLGAAGYATGLVGKWHLGAEEPYRPLNRGFQEHFGFLGGANRYLLPRPPQALEAKILRNGQEVDESEYLTDAFAREAVAFIDRHKDRPFFLFLAFNAPHTPNQATQQYLDRVAHIADTDRRTYAAMICAMDDAIGRVLDKLRDEKLDDNTLVFFLSDNGGQLKHSFPSNAPFRGGKGDTLEGGIRVPFLVRWAGRLPGGSAYDQPVISLDILPTALSAAGVRIDAAWQLDGVDLLPHLSGRAPAPPHDLLYWRFNFPPGRSDQYTWAVRRGEWKLIQERGAAEPKLFNLARDIGETRNLAGEHPRHVQSLRDAWERWNAQLVDASWADDLPARAPKGRPQSN
jgi:arylsulfatase A-like enzyme